MTITFILIILLSVVLAVWSKSGHGRQTPSEFFVASHQLGPVLFFFLSVGETYSIASMLGFPGGIYAHGPGFVIWFFGYILLAAPMVYFVGPWIWRAGSLYGSTTIADFFRSHFDSRPLELVIAATTIVLLIPIGTTQVLGLRLALISLNWHVPPIALTGLAGLLTLTYVAIAGLRASAYVAVLKDILMVVSILMVGLAAIVMFHAGGPVAHPLKVAQSAAHLQRDNIFALSTILVQSLGFVMVPQTWAFIFSARSVRTIRRAQTFAPLYMVMFPLLTCVAYYARGHGITPSTPDAVFIATAQTLLPPWSAGLVLAAASLSGLVILSGVCLAIGPLVTRNLFPGLKGDAQQWWAKVVVAAYLVLSIFNAEGPVQLMATLNNLFYFGIAQTLPGLLAAMCMARVSAVAVLSGMIAGDALALGLTVFAVDVGGLNVGLLGLVLNAAIMLAVSRIWPRAGALSVVDQLRPAHRV